MIFAYIKQGDRHDPLVYRHDPLVYRHDPPCLPTRSSCLPTPVFYQKFKINNMNYVFVVFDIWNKKPLTPYISRDTADLYIIPLVYVHACT